ncbi:MAG TPA: thioesterase family protein [Planctomycetota bacterium]|jgi:acyl-CoA thioester hydrolase|nr:thioesterase family protein [Planctomycetota bacterium]
MPFEHRYRRTVQFADTDMAGIVHFSWFFRYVEEAEHDFYRSMGFSIHRRGDTEPWGMPRLGARLEFLRPLRCEDVVEVHLWVRRKGRRSIVYQLEMRRADELVAKGEIAVGSSRTLADGRLEAVPLPAELSAQIEEAPYPPLEFR